jgi:hypothetical protein
MRDAEAMSMMGRAAEALAVCYRRAGRAQSQYVAVDGYTIAKCTVVEILAQVPLPHLLNLRSPTPRPQTILLPHLGCPLSMLLRKEHCSISATKEWLLGESRIVEGMQACVSHAPVARTTLKSASWVLIWSGSPAVQSSLCCEQPCRWSVHCREFSRIHFSRVWGSG